MGHYFEYQENLASKEHRFEASIGGKTIKFITDLGVFSRAHLDVASELLLKSLIEKQQFNQWSGAALSSEKRRVLDLGCGYGPLALFCKSFFPFVEMFGVEVNERAYHLAKKNAQLNHLDVRFFLEDARTYLEKEKFDIIVTNPPIRVGKEILYALLEKAYHALLPDGAMFLVVGKKQGADSMANFLKSLGGELFLLDKGKGFKVFVLKKKK